ncbi:hypothetical protein PMPD1_2793 [Paramixta manurensis]|uniref:Uncharacterized protein n=1 Tax=Paramixta manurensis TaxID=2740817 RepID=A0A6M8UJ04_9GAMM|nr:hypothetical protein PMPD1_2793 [Erwiniaceae bacterium PD-1]
MRALCIVLYPVNLPNLPHAFGRKPRAARLAGGTLHKNTNLPSGSPRYSTA